MDTTRRHPFTLMRREILKSHVGANAPEVGIHALRQTALIKCGTTLRSQRLEGVGKIRIA